MINIKKTTPFGCFSVKRYAYLIKRVVGEKQRIRVRKLVEQAKVYTDYTVYIIYVCSPSLFKGGEHNQLLLIRFALKAGKCNLFPPRACGWQTP